MSLHLFSKVCRAPLLLIISVVAACSASADDPPVQSMDWDDAGKSEAGASESGWRDAGGDSPIPDASRGNAENRDAAMGSLREDAHGLAEAHVVNSETNADGSAEAAVADCGVDALCYEGAGFTIPDAGFPDAPDPTTTKALISEILSSVDMEAGHLYLQQLVGEIDVTTSAGTSKLTSRSTRSDAGIAAATEFVYAHMGRRGLAVSYHKWTSGRDSGRNVIGEVRGALHPEQIIIVGAHVDDVPMRGMAPGADDNASGVATLMLFADITPLVLFDRTIRLVAFTGEEQGLLGSTSYADAVKNARENVVGMLSVDMIGSNPTHPPIMRLHTRRRGNDGYAADMELANAFVSVVSTYGLSNQLVPLIDADSVNNSDHLSFWRIGVPAMFVTEDDEDFSEYYHTTDDVLSHLDMAYLEANWKATIGTVATLAGPLARRPDPG